MKKEERGSSRVRLCFDALCIWFDCCVYYVTLSAVFYCKRPILILV